MILPGRSMGPAVTPAQAGVSRGMTALRCVADGNAVGYPRWIDQVEPTFKVGSTWLRRAMTKLGGCRLRVL